MNYIKTLFASVSLLVASSMFASDGYTIIGNIPGLKPGSKVELRNKEDRRGGHRPMVTVSNDGNFVLDGYIDMPSVCEIIITVPGNEIGYAFPIMIENVPYTITAVHIDSVSPSFFFGSGGLYQEKNVSIEGGTAQREFSDYRTAILPFEIAAKNAHYALYIDPVARKRTVEDTREFEVAYKQAEYDLALARRIFRNAYPTYHISAKLWNDALSDPFTFSDAELDEIWAKVKGNNSQKRVEQLEKSISKARECVKGKEYSDFTALDPNGVEHRISDLIGNGKWTLMDFWASWCGPCRASIPALKEIFKANTDNLCVISVSCDAEDAAWKKALQEEKMEWMQLRMPETVFKTVSNAYNFNSIPFMLLIDPEGNIEFAGHDPGVIESRLK